MMGYYMEAVSMAFVFGGICGALVMLQVNGRKTSAIAEKIPRPR